MLKRDFQGNTGQGPAAKRRDSDGAQGRLVFSTVFFPFYLKKNAGFCFLQLVVPFNKYYV